MRLLSLEPVEVVLRCELVVGVARVVIGRLRDQVEDHALVDLLELVNRKAQLFCPKIIEGRIYFAISWAASFFAAEVVPRLAM